MTRTTESVRDKLGVTSGLKRLRRKMIVIGGMVLLIGGGMVAFERWSVSANTNTVSYRTVKAETGDLKVAVVATGQLQPTRTVDVGSEVSGIIDTVLVDYNQQVTAGQVLARINTERLDAQVLQDKALLETARAKVADAKVTVTETEANYNRMKTARERSNGQLPSQADVDTALAAYERAKVAVASAEAGVIQAEATLKSDETNVLRAVIKAPVNGVVLARNVQAGQTIAASFSVTTMFQIAEDLRKMKLEVNIDEADMGVVREGQSVLFTVDAFPGRQFPGKITQVRYEATTTNNVVTYLAEISVDNSELRLRPGMTATASIVVQEAKNALLAPNASLRYEPGATTQSQGDTRSFLSRLMPGPPRMQQKNFAEPENTGPRVWVLEKNQPVAVPVETGITNGKLTELKNTHIKPGTELVTETVSLSK